MICPALQGVVGSWGLARSLGKDGADVDVFCMSDPKFDASTGQVPGAPSEEICRPKKMPPTRAMT